MGNICRSPTAEGAFRSIVEKNTKSQYFEIDSAGTHAYHICLLYTSDAADDSLRVDLGGRRIIKKR